MENYSSHIKIDAATITAQLTSHFVVINDKLTIRLFTIKPSGTQFLLNGLVDALHDALPYYVYGEADFARMGELRAGLNAKTFFGQKQTQSDGKYGELLLFVLVESILGCKMIAHKIRSLSNMSDQIKGGDGIFLGDYPVNGVPHAAYLIGESKVTATLGDALDDALKSLKRFHDVRNKSDFMSNELIVAQEFIKLTSVDLNLLYDRLTPTKQAYRDQVLVHPVLMMHSSKTFETLEQACKTPQVLEENIIKKLRNKDKVYYQKIAEKLAGYTDVKKVYLDFFILPCSSVDDFRNTLYQKIHGIPPVNTP